MTSPTKPILLTPFFFIVSTKEKMPVALFNASKELKEAAMIDGANIWRQIKAVE